MTFNSTEFLLFALSFFLIYGVLKSSLQRRLLLVAGSFFFYSWGNPIHLIFLILSGLIDYLIGNELHRKKNVFFLFLSIGLNLGILSLFKFSDFASETFHFSIFNKSYLLSGIPIGVSFYTFQSMSYSIDIYRRKLEPAKDVFHFFSFLAFFPQLVAGPICRGSELLGQLEILDSKEIKFEEAAKLLVIGFFQKMFLADQLGIYVDQSFSRSTLVPSGMYWWLVSISFGFQIYYDFSGYSNIARGLALLMGVDLPKNFDFPYFSKSLKTFWRRWHITLSFWFRDYVYQPLVGEVEKRYRILISLIATFTLSGVWHGSSWNFVLWGVYFGVMHIIERTLLTFIHKDESSILGRLWLVFSVSYGWMIFRTENLIQLQKITYFMFSDISLLNMNHNVKMLLLLTTLSIIFEFIFKALEKWEKSKLFLLEIVSYSFMLPALIFFRVGRESFIYFRF